MSGVGFYGNGFTASGHESHYKNSRLDLTDKDHKKVFFQLVQQMLKNPEVTFSVMPEV